MSFRHLGNDQLIFPESWAWRTETGMDVTLETEPVNNIFMFGVSANQNHPVECFLYRINPLGIVLGRMNDISKPGIYFTIHILIG